MRAGPFESTASPGRVLIGLLANVRRILTPTARAASIRDGQTLCDFDRDQLPADGRGAAG